MPASDRRVRRQARRERRQQRRRERRFASQYGTLTHEVEDNRAADTPEGPQTLPVGVAEPGAAAADSVTVSRVFAPRVRWGDPWRGWDRGEWGATSPGPEDTDGGWGSSGWGDSWDTPTEEGWGSSGWGDSWDTPTEEGWGSSGWGDSWSK
jgi:hypothetical protein